MFDSTRHFFVLLLLVCFGCGHRESVTESAGSEASAAIGSTEYLVAEGNLWRTDFDDEVFGICADLQANMDGRNMYRWAQDEILSLREKSPIRRRSLS